MSLKIFSYVGMISNFFNGFARKMSQKRSAIWNFFLSLDKERKVKCCLCEGIFSRSKHGSTGNLNRHLLTKHSGVFYSRGNLRSKSGKGTTYGRTQINFKNKAAAVQQASWQHGDEPSATTTNPNQFDVIKEEYDVTEQNVDEFQEIATVQGAEDIFKVYEPTTVNYSSAIRNDGGESSQQQLQKLQLLPSTSSIKAEPEYISSDDSMSFDGEASSSMHIGSVVSGTGAAGGRKDDDCPDSNLPLIGKSLRKKLAVWAVDSGLSAQCIEELLAILREENLDVPETAAELRALHNVQKTTMKKPTEVKPPANIEPVSPAITALQEENKHLMSEIKNIQKTVIDGQEKTIGVLKAEIQELNFGMKKIFKLLKENDITESRPPEFAKTFPIRTQNEIHEIELKAISDENYAERLDSCLQNMVSKLEPDKKMPFRKVFHDSLLNDSTWDGIHGLGSYRFCNSILFEAWKTPSLGMEEYVNRFKKEIAKRKTDALASYVEPKKLKI